MRANVLASPHNDKKASKSTLISPSKLLFSYNKTFASGDLLDYVVSFLDNTNETSEYDFPRICVVGRPNVGKSSLVNLLLDDEKNIVTNQAGTTRDSIDSYFKKYNK